MTSGDKISVGRIARSRGLSGEVIVQPMSDDPDRFATFGTVLVSPKDGPAVELEILSAQSHHRQGRIEVCLRLKDIDSRDKADALRGALISVDREVLPLEEGEYFLFDLEGLDVVTASGVAVGRIKDVQRMPAQDLLVIVGPDGTESLIPDVPEFVDKSQMDEGRVVITPIEGLLAETP